MTTNLDLNVFYNHSNPACKPSHGGAFAMYHNKPLSGVAYYQGTPLVYNDPAYRELNGAQTRAHWDMEAMDAPQLVPAGAWENDGDPDDRTRPTNPYEQTITRE